MRKGKQVSLIVAGALLCAAGVLTAVIHEVWGGSIPLFPKLGVEPQLGALATAQPIPTGADATDQPAGANLGQTLPASTSATGVIREDMSVFWVTRYTSCGHEVVRERAPDPETIGWSYDRFAQYYPGYTMTPLGTNLRMEHAVDQYCPTHYIIRSDEDGAIYVYRNVEGEVTLTQLARMNFTVDMVPQDYRDLLKEGMVFDSLEEIEGLIEDAET